MDLNATIYEYLTSLCDLTALVNTRIYPNVAPQDTEYPLIVYSTIWSERTHALQADTNISRRMIQFSVYGKTSLSVYNVAEKLRLALQNHSDSDIQAVLINNEIDGFDEASKEYYRHIDYEIFYNE